MSTHQFFTVVAYRDVRDILPTKTKTRAVLSQGEPRDAAVNFGIVSKFTASSCGFSATARLSCIGLHQRQFKCWNYTKYAFLCRWYRSVFVEIFLVAS